MRLFQECDANRRACCLAPSRPGHTVAHKDTVFPTKLPSAPGQRRQTANTQPQSHNPRCRENRYMVFNKSHTARHTHWAEGTDWPRPPHQVFHPLLAQRVPDVCLTSDTKRFLHVHFRLNFGAVLSHLTDTDSKTDPVTAGPGVSRLGPALSRPAKRVSRVSVRNWMFSRSVSARGGGREVRRICPIITVRAQTGETQQKSQDSNTVYSVQLAGNG